MALTPRLNRWQQMQRQPIGSLATSMDAPTAAQSGYRQDARDYSRALRNLGRLARRGDPNASLAAIQVRQQARDQGIGGLDGIRRSEDQAAAAQAFERRLDTDARQMEESLARNSPGSITPRLDSGPATPRLDSMRTPGMAATEGPVESAPSRFDTRGIDLRGNIVETATGPLAQARQELARRIETDQISGSELVREQRRLGISDRALSRFSDNMRPRR